MWARIENKKVVELVNFDPTSMFHPTLIFVKCVGDVRQDYLYIDGVFNAVAPQSEQEKTQSQIDSDLKMAGVLIQGVMCSATTADSNGLLAVNVWVGRGHSTRFEFANGNTLLLTPSNHDYFASKWMAFRQSFYKSV